MSFSYQFGNNPQIDIVRFLISDTQDVGHILEDSEILMCYTIAGAVNQSSMTYSTGTGTNLPSSPVSYYRVAAVALDAIATNNSKLAGAIELLDVKLDLGSAAKALKDQAAAYREIDDNSGSFAIIEQCNTLPSFRDRFWKQRQRQIGGIG